MKTIMLIYLILGFLTIKCQGANILFFFGVSTYSHRITVWPLVEALADRGHSVTFLQPFENKSPNPKVKEIVPKRDGVPPDFLQYRFQQGPMLSKLMAFNLPNLGAMVCKQILNDPEVMKWINTCDKFDLVVIDGLYNDCGHGFAYKWGAETIIFGTSSVFEWWGDTYGFDSESSSIANMQNALDLPLTFLQRVVSTLGHLYFRYSKVGMLHPAIEPLLKERLNIQNMPPLAELESNVSLILMNTHFSEEFSRALPPLIVPVGGMHCTEKTKPLPKEIEDFIGASGKEGFIYISFGSRTSITSGPKELKDSFFKAIGNIKTKFVWKWEGKRPDDMPSNVYTAEWLPQQAVLAHPKIKAFITHGGLLSIQESIFNGVPMIVFPIFAEQDYNAERVHRTKRGIRLEITTVTQLELEGAIKTILTDDTYLKNVKKTSIIFKDRPEKPLDTALWWVEYVLCHKDTSFLRPLSITQTWYEKRLLDVWAFIGLVCITSLSLILFIIIKMLSYSFGYASKPTTNRPHVKKD